MAAEFIGYAILVTLQSPSGSQIHGFVSDVINQKLYLRDVTVPGTNQKYAAYTLDASNIQDLEIAPTLVEEEAPTPTATAPNPPSQSQPQPFVDPAILSYGRNGASKKPSVLQTPVSPIMIADGANPSPIKQTLRGQSSISSIATARKPSRRDSTATATLTEPFDALSLKEKQAEKRISQTGPGVIDLRDVHPNPPKQTATKKQQQPGRGRGWRNTPLIEEKKPTPPTTAKKIKRGRQQAEDPNGWATEDATDIADMGEFDFVSNHAKFDKRAVFDDIRRDDTTADEERLVSFNRVKARPGTNGGRNLHFTENVLDVPSTQDPSRWKSEAGETEEDGDAEHKDYSSGRNSRRAGSRRPLQSRKGSVIPSHLDRKEPSPRPLTRLPTGSPLNGSVSGTGRVMLKVASTNKTVSAISPLQMLEMEQLCTSELGLSEDMLTETAGHSIAEAIFKANTAEFKNVLFLLGNHKTSARALAAARHLRNRRVRVVVCIVGLERGEELLLEVVRKQLRIYRASLGAVERWEDYQAKLGTSPNASTILPPDFVVDALLGQHHTFEELRTDDQATIFSMIKWAGMMGSAPIMSIDVPSGISATTGLVAEVDGGMLSMASTTVVCLSAPKIGLWVWLNSEQVKSELSVVVVDTGISLVAWQRNGSRRKQGIEFGREWVVPLKIVYS